MKLLFSSLLLVASLSSIGAVASSQQPSNIHHAIKLSANEGPLCSDGTRCDAQYSHCCDIKGTATCVKSLSDCHE